MADGFPQPRIWFEATEIVLAGGDSVTLHLAPGVAGEDVNLVLDLYDLAAPVHPEGHVGWWTFAVETLADPITCRLKLSKTQIEAAIEGASALDRWINDQRVSWKGLILIAVLRSRTTNAIVDMARLPVLRDAAGLKALRGQLDRDWSRPRFASASYVAPQGSTVRIVSRSLAPLDAVGNFAFDVFRLLRQNGMAAQLYSTDARIDINDVARDTRWLGADTGPDDSVVFFHSMAEPLLPQIAELPCARRIAYFHGITEPRLVQVFDPELAQALTKGQAQMPLLAAFDVIATNSMMNAARLIESFGEDTNWHAGDIPIVPPKLMPPRPATSPRRTRPPARDALLYVGRIKSHKRIEHILMLFAEYLKLSPDAECWIAGAAGDRTYRDYLTWVERTQLKLPEGKVKWLGAVAPDGLEQLYRSASAYVSMSEDEGYCLPVFEAMQQGLPVFAYALPPILDLLEGTGLTFERKEYPHLAAALHALVHDKDRRAEIVARQLTRAAAVAASMDGSAVLDLLSPALARPRR